MIKKLSNDEIKLKRFLPTFLAENNRFPIYALLENIRSLYNVGSMFRTADGARISELLLAGFTPHPPRKELLKTSLGAIETVPWQYFKNPIDSIEYLKSKNVKITAVELTDKSFPNYEIKNNDFPLCVVFGNEITGISNDLLKHVDDSIEIPMYGVKHSLNVSVAFGIVLFDLLRILNQKEQK